MQRKAAIFFLAGLLVLGTGAWTGHRLTEQRIEWTWPLRAPSGQPGFALILNSWSWRWVSGGPVDDWERTLVTDRANLRLSAIVAHGFEKVPDGCPKQWQLSDVHPLPDGGIFISGFCTDAAKVKGPPNSSRRARL